MPCAATTVQHLQATLVPDMHNKTLPVPAVWGLRRQHRPIGWMPRSRLSSTSAGATWWPLPERYLRPTIVIVV